MRIVFVRHGEPNYEKDCLTERGRIQARAAAERLREEGIETIFSSPFGRAAETARATAEALNLPVNILDFMHELHWGSADGQPIFADGHPWNIADELARQGWDPGNPAWREHPFFVNNRVTAEADNVAAETDRWLRTLGYERRGAYYRCVREDDRQATVALFSHGGSSSAALAHILNSPFPQACGLFHFEFTGITVIRLSREPGSQTAPALELVNDSRHPTGLEYPGPAGR